jgi:hypothetical protein
MSFLKPDPPTPPNPIDTARAATGTNVGTAIANAQLQNINQVTPGGNLQYSTTGNYDWTDPTTGATYSVPQFTATQTLSPSGTWTNAKQEQTKELLADTAYKQASRAAGVLGTTFAPTATGPQGGQAGRISALPAAATTFAGGGPIQKSLGQQGDITQTYGPADNFSADRQRVENSLMARMNPQLQIEQQRVQQQLADQGIRYGSQAYGDAMTNYSRQADDARWGAIQNAGQEQQRMVQEAAQLAAFQNAAQQQGYEQSLGAGQFVNAAQAQQFGQNAQAAQFGNLGLAQQLQQQQAAFNAAQAQRGAYMQEQFAQRNQPLNEIAALMSGSQVGQPNFVNTPGAQIPTTDVAGLINQNFAQQLGIYQQQSQNTNQLIGGVLGLGAGALRASDRRLKENVSKMGTVFAADAEGERKQLPIYAYSYKADPASARHVGPMAQDVEKITPEAVEEHGGRKFIRPREVMGSIMRAG